MNDLEDLLRETLSVGSLAAPGAAGLASQVVARERRRRRRQVGGVVACAAAVVGIVGAAALLSTGTRGVGVVPAASLAPTSPVVVTPTVHSAGPIQVTGLDKASVLPPNLHVLLATGTRAAATTGVVADGTGTAHVILYQGTDDQVCLLIQQNNVGGEGSCREVAELEHKPLFIAVHAAHYDNPVQLAAVLPDGYTTLTDGSDTATAKSNLAYLPDIRSTIASMSGPGLPTKTVDLGPDVGLPTATGLPPLPATFYAVLSSGPASPAR